MTDVNQPASSAPVAAPASQGDTSKSQDAKPGDQKTVPLAALQEERDKRQALQQSYTDLQREVEALKNLVGGSNIQPNFNAPQSQPQTFNPMNTPAPQGVNIDELWEEEPKRAVQTSIAAALNWYDSLNMKLSAQEDMLAQKYPDFNNFRSDARTFVSRLPLMERDRQGIVEAAYLIVKGQRSDSIVEARAKELLAKMQAGENVSIPSGGSGATGSTGEPFKLSEEQKQAARAMGMTETDYAKHMVKK